MDELWVITYILLSHTYLMSLKKLVQVKYSMDFTSIVIFSLNLIKWKQFMV